MMNCSSVNVRVPPSVLFNGIIDRFNGITVRSWEEPCHVQHFNDRLAASLSSWQTKGIRGVWFEVGLQHTEWIPVLVKFGFKFHHCKPNYTAMCNWLPTNSPNMIPVYAHTTVGIGAIVVTDDRSKVLVVQENYKQKNMRIWKFPGGYVEPGEELSHAAQREVLEETGIPTEFRSIVSFRHNTRGYNFNCSDLYFIAHLKPLGMEIQKDQLEIAKCQWMGIGEFLNHPESIKMNKHFLRKFLENEKEGITIASKTMQHPVANHNVQMFGIEKTNKLPGQQQPFGNKSQIPKM